MRGTKQKLSHRRPVCATVASQKGSDKVTTNPSLALLASPEFSAWDLFTDESLLRSLRDPRARKQPCGYQSLGSPQCQTKTGAVLGAVPAPSKTFTG